MQILPVGHNYRSAPLEAREGLSFSPMLLPEALPLPRRDAGVGVIQSARTRTEFYALLHGLFPQTASPYLCNYTDEASVRQSRGDAGGLDSMILRRSRIPLQTGYASSYGH